MKASDGSDKELLAEVWRDDLDEGSYFSGTTYSPDGKQIAYVRIDRDYVHSNGRLYKMNASDGSNKQLIYTAYNPGPGHYPYGEAVFLSGPDWGVKVQS